MAVIELPYHIRCHPPTRHNQHGRTRQRPEPVPQLRPQIREVVETAAHLDDGCHQDLSFRRTATAWAQAAVEVGAPSMALRDTTAGFCPGSPASRAARARNSPEPATMTA